MTEAEPLTIDFNGNENPHMQWFYHTQREKVVYDTDMVGVEEHPPQFVIDPFANVDDAP